MSDQRESSTLTIVLSVIGTSLAFLGVSEDTFPLILRSEFGFIIGSIGIVYREVTIFQESREGLMSITNKNNKIRNIRLIRSLLLRLFQTIPLMICGMFIIKEINPIFVSPLWMLIIFIALILTANEHIRLWKREKEKLPIV